MKSRVINSAGVILQGEEAVMSHCQGITENLHIVLQNERTREDFKDYLDEWYACVNNVGRIYAEIAEGTRC